MHIRTVEYDEENFNRDLILNTVNLCINRGDYILAIGNIEFGLSIYPEYFEFQNLMGYVLTNQGNYQEALDWLLKAESKVSEKEDDYLTIFDKIDNWT